jgi:hypothetical protein
MRDCPCVARAMPPKAFILNSTLWSLSVRNANSSSVPRPTGKASEGTQATPSCVTDCRSTGEAGCKVPVALRVFTCSNSNSSSGSSNCSCTRVSISVSVSINISIGSSMGHRLQENGRGGVQSARRFARLHLAQVVVITIVIVVLVIVVFVLVFVFVLVLL